jgi:hypothetical protein
LPSTVAIEGIFPAPKAAAGEGRMRRRTQATRNSDPPKVEIDGAIVVIVERDCLTFKVVVCQQKSCRQKKI